MANNFRQWSSRKKGIAVAIAILLLGVIAVTGWVYFTGEATPDDSKRALWKYLAKQTRTKNFKTDLDLSTAALNSPVPRPRVTRTTTVVTNGPGITNRTRITKMVTNMVSAPTGKAAVDFMPETSFSPYFRTNQMQAETYQDMYRFIGQQLFVAEALLEMTNEQQQLVGLVLACEASNYARTNALNVWLGARICEAYVWPSLSLAERTNRTQITSDALLNLCDNAFQDAGETNNIIRNYELMIAKVSRSPAYVDLLRYRLAHIYQDLGQEEKALPLLKEIKNYRMNRVPQEIAAMEQRLKGK